MFLTFLFLFTGVLFVFAPDAKALTVTLNPVEFSTIYSYQQDVVLLDLALVPRKSGETLQALTVKDMLSSSTASKLASLTLWSDAGPEGFQGWLQDTEIASGGMDSTGVWIFSPLKLPIRDGGTRLFVSATAGQILSRRYLVQFGIPQLADANADGMYQTGDLGMFLDPADNGPTEALVNANMKELSPSSVLVSPQSAITSPSHGANVDKGSDVVVGGKARAVGGNPAVAVQLRWGTTGAVSSSEWKTVLSAATVTDWQYHWTPAVLGDMVLETRGLDTNGQSGQTQAITVHVVVPVPAATPPVSTPSTDSYQNTLVRTSDNAAVYYVYGGARWAFPNENIFKSWYADFSSVKVVDAQKLASWRLAGAVTYRAGTRLVKLQTDPKVYAVSKGGALRWVSTEAAAIVLFGSGWSRLVDDLSDAFFPHYTVGSALTVTSSYSPTAELAGSITIAQDKNL